MSACGVATSLRSLRLQAIRYRNLVRDVLHALDPTFVQAAAEAELARVAAAVKALAAREACISGAVVGADACDDGRRVFDPELDMVLSLTASPEKLIAAGVYEHGPHVQAFSLSFTFEASGLNSFDDADEAADVCAEAVQCGSVLVEERSRIMCAVWPEVCRAFAGFASNGAVAEALLAMCDARHKEWYSVVDWVKGTGVFTASAVAYLYMRRGVVEDECLLPL